MNETAISGRRAYRSDPEHVCTAADLIRILSTANPDALILVGRGTNDCEDIVERVIINDHTVLLCTEPDDEEDRSHAD